MAFLVLLMPKATIPKYLPKWSVVYLLDPYKWGDIELERFRVMDRQHPLGLPNPALSASFPQEILYLARSKAKIHNFLTSKKQYAPIAQGIRRKCNEKGELPLIATETVTIMPKERNVIKTGISINCSEGFKLELKNVNTINSQMGLIILETTLSGESEEEILIWIFNSSNSPKMIVDGDLLANIVCNRVILPKIGIQGSENLPPDFKRKNNKMDKLELDTGIREQVTDTCPILVIKLDDVSLAAFLDGGCSKNIIDYSLVQSLGWSDRITENNTRFGVVGGTTSNAI
ncbi:hypothetical protein CONCODRAFT_9150, partial [Conidiobolus coronatus NRRL 28638]